MTSNTYRTRDLNFASYLFAKGCDFIGLEYDHQGNFYWFNFTGEERFTQLEQQFWGNGLEINAKEYANAIQFLKKRINSESIRDSESFEANR